MLVEVGNDTLSKHYKKLCDANCHKFLILSKGNDI
uniref:Uncharacterized protein n=1 Tax=Rhizophora mucronata TaxID=61149 RepID=A0A2P2JAG4_RHIMU